MPRKRTGSIELRKTGYFARVTVTDTSGKTSRRWVPLNTRDEKRARKMVDIVNGQFLRGERVALDVAAYQSRETVGDLFKIHIEERRVRDTKYARAENSYYTHHLKPALDGAFVAEVRPTQVLTVLELAAKSGLRQRTLGNVRKLLAAIFDIAVRTEIIDRSPVDKVRTPKALKREVEKERVILDDAEVDALFAHPGVKLELKMAGLAARVQGGMRSADLIVWDWQSIKLDVGTCVVPRTKTERPQEMNMPAVLVGALRAWWLKSGSPSSGPVFPVTRGPRKGQGKAYGTNFSAPLRKALRIAGIDRHEVHHETETTKPATFHSFRRAFASALADAGINEQRAMKLTGHASADVHRKYVNNTSEMRTVPDAALPKINRDTLAELARPWTIAADETGNTEANEPDPDSRRIRQVAPDNDLATAGDAERLTNRRRFLGAGGDSARRGDSGAAIEVVGGVRAEVRLMFGPAKAEARDFGELIDDTLAVGGAS